MKRILAIAIALCLALSGLAALADVRLPERPIPNERLARRFSENLERFVDSIDLDSEALVLEITEAGETLLRGFAQGAEDGLILRGDLMGQTAELRIAEDALYVTVDGQCYRMSAEDVMALLSMLQGLAPFSDPQILYELAQLAVNDIIMPAVSVSYQEDGLHITINLTGDGLIKGLIRYGDDVVGNDRYLNAVASLARAVNMQQNFTEALSVDYAGEIREGWKQARAALEQTHLPFLLSVNITSSSDALRANGICQVSVEGEDMRQSEDMTLTGSFDSDGNGWTLSCKAIDSQGMAGSLDAAMDLMRGAFSANLQARGGNAVTLDMKSTENGVIEVIEIVSGGVTVERVETNVTDDGRMFELRCNVEQPMGYGGEMETMTVLIRFDRTSGVLLGQLTTPESVGVGAQLTGLPIGTGYKLKGTVTQSGEVMGNAEVTINTTDDGVFTLEALAYPGATPSEQKASLGFAFDSRTYAYAMDYQDPSQSVIADGVLSERQLSLHAATYLHGRELGRVDFDWVNDYRAFSLDYAAYEADYRGERSKTQGICLNVDKYTGAFSGSVEDRWSGLNFEGIVTDGAFRFLLTPLDGNEVDGLLEISGLSNDEGVTGQFTYTDYYDTTSGSFMFTENYQSLTLVSEDMESMTTVSLTEDAAGTPTALRIISGDYYDSFELMLDAKGLTVISDEEKYTVSGSFKDENTFVLDFCQAERYGRERHAYVTVTVSEDAIDVAAIPAGAEAGADSGALYTARISRGEQAAVESLDTYENIIDITPEMVMAMIGRLIESTQEVYDGAAQPDDYPEAAAWVEETVD